MIFFREYQTLKSLPTYLINNNIFVYSVFAMFSLLLGASIWLFFPVSSSGVHYYSLGLYFLLVIGIAIFISYKKDLSIPLVRDILKREYFRAKFKQYQKDKKSLFVKVYLKILYYLIMLFKNSQDSFNTLREDFFIEFSDVIEKVNKKKRSMFIRNCFKIFYFFSLLFKSSEDGLKLLKEDKINDEIEKTRQIIEKVKSNQEVDPVSLSELEKELFEFSKFKQKKATVFSLTAITALIITTVTAGLISSFLFPEVFKTKAASYGFLQTSWAGGASSDNATHSDQTGWTKYLSKDNVSTTTPTELKLSLTTTAIFTQTSDSDWQTHATSSTYYLNGSVGILKTNGATCSAVVECSSGFCVDGYCCNTTCTEDCKTCGASGTEGTCSGLTVSEDGACTGICTSCVAGTCTNRSAEDTTEGCSTACYDCVAGSCTATSDADDGSCTGACTSCSSGTCTNGSIDSQPSGCNSTCQYCDGSGSCATVHWEYYDYSYNYKPNDSGQFCQCRPSNANRAWGTGSECYISSGGSSAACSLTGRAQKAAQAGVFVYRFVCSM